jgi:beta-carotene/zeaxanthin 4-ketolase
MVHSRFNVDVGNRGLIAAGIIFLGWTATLCFFVTRPLSINDIVWIPFAIWLRTFLNVGLFISAHDAMHGTLYPKSSKVNHAFGAVAVALYAGFSYGNLLQEHHKHHNLSGTLEDPDFANSYDHGFFQWFFTFMLGYCSVAQLTRIFVMCVALLLIVRDPVAVVLFWAVPAILSAVQLFYFGTYRPHRVEAETFADEHRARSTELGPIYSFLTCYHFGYHLEHHRYPWVPWWGLPSIRGEAKELGIHSLNPTDAS